MQNYDGIRTISIVLIILNVIVLVFLPNFTYAQIQTLYEITKYTPTQVAYIPTGKTHNQYAFNT